MFVQTKGGSLNVNHNAKMSNRPIKSLNQLFITGLVQMQHLTKKTFLAFVWAMDVISNILYTVYPRLNAPGGVSFCKKSA